MIMMSFVTAWKEKVGHMNKTTVIAGLVCAALYGCVGSITDVKVKDKESACVRQCSSFYSQCIGNSGETNNKTIRACNDGYEVCTQSCPSEFKP